MSEKSLVSKKPILDQHLYMLQSVTQLADITDTIVLLITELVYFFRCHTLIKPLLVYFHCYYFIWTLVFMLWSL